MGKVICWRRPPEWSYHTHFCIWIGGPDGRLTDNVPVESDTCNTEYTVKYL